MSIKNFDEVAEQLYPKLGDYLEEKGFDTNHHFTCINPAHEDDTPSMSLHPDGKTCRCWSCLLSLNIFQACHILDKRPISGAGFIADNFMYLAQKYDIEVETTPLTEEQIYEIDTYRAYETAANIIRNGSTELSKKATEERGWSKETCEKFLVGTVSSYKDFRETLKKAGFKAKFLDDIDLSREDIFNETRLIFTITDERGRPVGFSARNLDYKPDKSNGPKYINTATKCPIYKKSKRLYGLNRIITEHSNNKSVPIYLFEGYADTITADQYGVDNTVTIAGLEFTDDQALLLKKYGFFNIIVCLDGDKAGQRKTISLLDGVFSRHKDFRVSIVTIPEELDPDNFIRKYSTEEFYRLKQYSAFEWRLSMFDDETSPEETCKTMIPLIAHEPSHVVQENMCKILSQFTGVSVSAIKDDLASIQNQQAREKIRERQVILDQLKLGIDRNPNEAEHLLQVAELELTNLAKKYDEDGFSEESCVAILNTQKMHEESKDGTFSGFILGDELKLLERATAGECKTDVWICIGGNANTGKTSMATQWGYHIAREEENDACIIYHSIDDTVKQILPKFVAEASETTDLVLDQVMDPKYYIDSNENLDNETKSNLWCLREKGYDRIRDLMKRGRLVIKDADNGTSITYARRLIRYYKNKYPGRNIVYILDNFHKLQDFSDSFNGNDVARYKKISTIMKDLATSEHICVISTVEYKKIQKGEKAGNADLGYTNQIIYDANFVAHLYNEMHERGENATSLFTDNIAGKEKNLPIIELNVGKNKINGYKGNFYLKFWPDCSRFQSITRAELQAYKNERLAMFKEEYFDMLNEIQEREGNLNAAYYQFKDRFGFDPERSWLKEYEQEFNNNR